jgi:hypothetical protein
MQQSSSVKKGLVKDVSNNSLKNSQVPNATIDKNLKSPTELQKKSDDKPIKRSQE